jgi:biotin transport system substrate-specific component
MSTITLDRWKLARYQVFRWRYELSVVQKLGLAVGMAVLTGLLAQVRVPLPWTPVPITGQTFAVLLAGVMLGRWWGGISQTIYVAVGIAGVPWFTGWQGGLGHLAGPTGGYLIGFILAALLIGHLTDKSVKVRHFPALLALMVTANFILIYVPGLLQLGLWLNAAGGKHVGIYQLLNMGLIPFIIGDLIKVTLVSTLAWGVTPKRRFDSGNQ